MTEHTQHTSHRSRRVGLAAVLLTFAVIAAGCTSDGDDGTITLGASDTGGLAAPGAEAGTVESEVLDTAVSFTFDKFDGDTMTYDDLPDGPVVLNFFASWCPPCIAEMPDFQAVSQTFGTEVQFVGLAVQDRVENAVALVEETGVTYQVGNDQNGTIFSSFGGLGMPTTVFITADGTVAKVHSGVLDAESLTETINEELLS